MSLLSLGELFSKESLVVAGIMSGTSMDSITTAICNVSKTSVKLIDYKTFDYSEKTRRLLENCLELRTPQISELNFLVGQDSSKALAEHAKILGLKIHLCGFHGQTVFHHSGLAETKSSLQVGVGEYIAQDLGCYVVCDFRFRDIVVNGEGAPLSPWGDLRLFGLDRPFAVLNIGGVANYTFIDRSKNLVIGFDTGPGNSLLDRTVRKLKMSALGYDRNGELGRLGDVDNEILSFMLDLDKFFDVQPPKSCGFERFGDEFVEKILTTFPGKRPVDILRTVYEFTILGIVSGLKFMPKIDELILCGGGSQNSLLVEEIRKRVGCRVTISDDYGIPWHAREAMIFAVLAFDFLHGIPTNIPSVTGAKQPVLLGRLICP